MTASGIDSLYQAMQAASVLGHDFTPPLSLKKVSGKRLYMTACMRCDQTLLSIENSNTVSGSGKGTHCIATPAVIHPIVTNTKSANTPPRPKPQVVVNPTTRTIVVQTGAIDNSPDPIELRALTIEPCVYCGNGSTISGKGCRHCSIDKQLTIRDSRRVIHDWLPLGIKYGPKRYRHSLTERVTAAQHFRCPRGHFCTRMGVYLPVNERLTTLTVPLVCYACECHYTILDNQLDYTAEDIDRAEARYRTRQPDAIQLRIEKAAAIRRKITLLMCYTIYTHCTTNLLKQTLDIFQPLDTPIEDPDELIRF